MIYCGYQGVGKSTYCRENPNTTIDLDSSNFKKHKGWVCEYVEIAYLREHMENKDVFISAHKEVIEYLMAHDIPFEVLVPANNRNAWEHRLKFRYYQNPTQANYNAISDFKKNYYVDMHYYADLETKGITIHRISARVVTTIGKEIK